MLVLTRKANQRVFIGESIEVRVLETSGGSVKLGFTCPPEVAIHREEVRKRIQAEDQGQSCLLGGIHVSL